MKTFLFCLALLPLFAFAQTNDSLQCFSVKDTVSSGHKKFIYAGGSLHEEGDLVHWVREGWWVTYRENGIKSSEIFFKHGTAVRTRNFDEKGQQVDASFNLVEKEASFPGGVAAWNNYLQAAVLKKAKYLNRKKAGGHLEVQFVIETDGSVGEVSTIESTGTEFDNVVMDIIRNSPRWEPGVQNNRKVKAYRTQSLNYVPDGK